MSEYAGALNGRECTMALEREGLAADERLIDFADVLSIAARNHRVFIETEQGTEEVSMLGFTFDGFWDELLERFGARSLEALFVEGAPMMACEGEYAYLGESGHARILLFADSVCVLPPTKTARRIPLCFVDAVDQQGYLMTLQFGGDNYTIGRMGYDTQPFFERLRQNRDRVIAVREERLAALRAQAPFDAYGLFRTDDDGWFMAAFGTGCCAVELKVGEDAATYLYRFEGSRDAFFGQLRHAMEAMGTHREAIFIDAQKLATNPVYRMAIERTPSVQFLRAASDGRLIHSWHWTERLREYLNG